MGINISELRGVSLAIWDHTVLPATRQKWTRLAAPANQAGTRFTYPRGTEGWIDLGSLIAAWLLLLWPTWQPHYSKSKHTPLCFTADVSCFFLQRAISEVHRPISIKLSHMLAGECNWENLGQKFGIGSPTPVKFGTQKHENSGADFGQPLAWWRIT